MKNSYNTRSVNLDEKRNIIQEKNSIFNNYWKNINQTSPNLHQHLKFIIIFHRQQKQSIIKLSIYYWQKFLTDDNNTDNVG